MLPTTDAPASAGQFSVDEGLAELEVDVVTDTDDVPLVEVDPPADDVVIDVEEVPPVEDVELPTDDVDMLVDDVVVAPSGGDTTLAIITEAPV